MSTAEKFLPAIMTSVKTVRISKVDKVIAMENDSLSDADLLKGVKLVKDGYVCLAGLVVVVEEVVEAPLEEEVVEVVMV